MAKSRCKCRHGVVGQDQGSSGEAGGAFLVLWHCWYSRTVSLMSLSIPGHQTWLHAIAFMRAIPGWASWSTLRIGGLKAGGMIVHTESSFLRVKYGLSWGSAQKWRGQPARVGVSALANVGFLEVSLTISVAETGCRFSCWLATKNISLSTLASFLNWRGNRDKVSALATSADGLNSIS